MTISHPRERVATRPTRAARPAPPPRAHPNAVLAAVAVGAALVVALWWQNTPPFTGLGNWLTNAGRVTGLLASYSFVVLVALMARIPPLERGIGADVLARWHAQGGRYTVNLVIAHAMLITWGYAVLAHSSVVHQVSSLLLSYPDVLMATVAGALLVGVGVVSARAARRRMRYETWYFLHFYTYLAMALAFSHQFADGAEFADNRNARLAWSALYVIVGAAIFWYRFVVPIRQSFRHRLRVAAVKVESPDTVSIIVSGHHLDELRSESGQFFRWRFLTRQLWWASNPYSLSAGPRPKLLRITVKDLGGHSAELSQIRVGTRVFAEGPYGAMTAARRRQTKVLLIAGGIGITPLRALFETLPGTGRNIALLYRSGHEHDVVFRNELVKIAEQRRAGLHMVTGHRADLGYDPLSARALLANFPDLRERDIYLCGPASMTVATVAALRQAKVPRRQIHRESFEF